jgi:hypothetical protein
MEKHSDKQGMRHRKQKNNMENESGHINIIASNTNGWTYNQKKSREDTKLYC